MKTVLFAAWLTLLCALICSLPAHAVRVADQGQALIYPVYSTEKLDTLLTLNNRSNQAKAVALTLREGDLGSTTLSLTVYLAPQDTFTAAITNLQRLGLDDQPGILLTPEESTCTVPAINRSVDNLPGVRYQPLLRFDPDEFGATPESHRSGYAEAIEVGEIDLDAVDVTDCNGLNDRWINGPWATDPLADLLPPGGRLNGQTWLLDVANGESYQLSATALANYRQTALAANDLLEYPSIAFAGQSLEADIVVDNTSYKVQFETAFEAVSAALATTFASADLIVDPRLDATTEVLFTLPTFFDAFVGADDTTLPPFIGAYAPASRFEPGQRAVIEYEIADRQGNADNSGDCWFDSVADVYADEIRSLGLERALSVMTLGSDAAVGITGIDGIVTRYSQNQFDLSFLDPSDGVDGQLSFAFGPSSSPPFSCIRSDLTGNHRLSGVVDSETIEISGLPILVSSMTRIRNGTLGDGSILANYGAAAPAVRMLVSPPGN